MAAELGWLALARGTLDRKAERRRDDAWLERAWNDPRTRVVVVEDGHALVRFGDSPALILDTPAEVDRRERERRRHRQRVPEPAQGAAPRPAPETVPQPAPETESGRESEDGRERYLLGVDGDGVAYFAVPGPLPAIDGAEPASLRRAGALLDDRDAGLFTHALALRNWHATHPRCPRCGAPTRLAAAGHMRICPRDGSEHFPRVDPAVIMLVYDDRDRILLAGGPKWPEGRVSVLAGFVEPGESLEQAVAREVREEVGLSVDRLRYLGSQPWPLPQSLMIGFFAHARDGQRLRPDGSEIAYARWFTRAELRAAEESAEILLPGRLSIARHLINAWYEAGRAG